MHYTYTESGATRNWAIDSYDVPDRDLSLTETRPDGTTLSFSWDDTLKRLQAAGGSPTAPDLSGSWGWSSNNGASSTVYTWVAVTGSAVQYTYVVSGVTYTATVQPGYTNSPPSMTVYVNTLVNPSPAPAHIYTWSTADQRLNSTTNTQWSWTKQTTQTFPSGSGEYWTRPTSTPQQWPSTVSVTKNPPRHVPHRR